MRMLCWKDNISLKVSCLASTVEILKGAQEEKHTENYNSAQEEHTTATGDHKIIKPE